MSVEQLATPAEVEAAEPQAMGLPGRYVWAWIDEPAGLLRSRYFATDIGIREDEATGSAAIVMGEGLRRQLVIRQGVGSEILVEPCDDGTIEIGGRSELVDVRPFG
jgi:predicted PhzF superfamily epimerase YddE/YHI9